MKKLLIPCLEYLETIWCPVNKMITICISSMYSNQMFTVCLLAGVIHVKPVIRPMISQSLKIISHLIIWLWNMFTLLGMIILIKYLKNKFVYTVSLNKWFWRGNTVVWWSTHQHGIWAVHSLNPAIPIAVKQYKY